MVRLGASGATAGELDLGLGLSSNDTAQISKSFNEVLAAFEDSGILRIANKVYVMKGFELRDEFSSLLTEQFLSSAEHVDFARNVEAAG